ncbi:hypothetical protein TNCV_497581 [Trichonephila clavipes]|nr:hypothetical protein TNCV_497581 [Trichonephila clavipes]
MERLSKEQKQIKDFEQKQIKDFEQKENPSRIKTDKVKTKGGEGALEIGGGGRNNLKCLGHREKPAMETFQMLIEAYGEETLSRARVFEWHERFSGEGL